MSDTAEKLKIMFVCRHFDGVAGGVERMSIVLMNAMVARGHQVHLITWDPSTARAFYPMDERIKWHRIAGGDVGVRASWRDRWLRARQVRNILRTVRPDVAIGFQFGSFLVAWLYGLGLQIPVIAAERNSPSRYQFQKNESSNWQFLIFFFAAKITVQWKRYRSYYPWYLRRKIIAIHNPIISGNRPVQAKFSKRHRLISVGRLTYQKNTQVLVRAFAQLAVGHPDWDLHIAGEGEDRAELEAMITKDHLGARIFLHGNIQNMADFYRQGDVFVLPSRWEGFPNALAEAMTYGLPAVGFADCDGVADLIVHQQTGLLVPGADDVNGLAAVLIDIMGNPDRRSSLGLAAWHRTLEFAPETIFNLWEKVFIQARRPTPR